MRLFVAIVPPPAAVADLSARLPELAELAPELRFPPAHKWHLTVTFLGEVSDARAAKLPPRLAAAAASATALQLSLGGGGTFPKRADRARVLWTGVRGDVEPLVALAAEVAAAVRAVGVRLERRAYHPHLTLARARRATGDATAAVEALRDWQGPTWTAGELELVSSTLGPQARYDTIGRWPLGG